MDATPPRFYNENPEKRHTQYSGIFFKIANKSVEITEMAGIEPASKN